MLFRLLAVAKEEDDLKKSETLIVTPEQKQALVAQAQTSIKQLVLRMNKLKERAKETTKIPSNKLLELDKKVECLSQPDNLPNDAKIKNVESEINLFRQQYLQYFLRLNPTELNALLGFLPNQTKIITYQLQVRSGLQEVSWKLDSKDNADFYTFSVVKDNPNPDYEPYLSHIGDVVAEFKKIYPEKKGTLLLPMRQCCDYLSNYIDLKKLWPTSVDLTMQHIVLVEINLEKKTIDVHDSSTQWLLNGFPDKLLDVAKEHGFTYDPASHYHYYANQTENCLCGYYVNEFVQSILLIGNASQCAEIKLDTKNYETKNDYIRKRGKMPNWGKFPKPQEAPAAKMGR